MNTAHQAASLLKQRIPDFAPRIAIILGSGLNRIAEDLIADDPQHVVVPYSKIPGFPECRVGGHHGQLVYGRLRGVPVLCMQGRAHAYEGTSPSVVKTLIRTLKLCECEQLILTNAAGSLNPDITAGQILLITDHINMLFTNPLVGPNDEEFGHRFVDMSQAYDLDIRNQFLSLAQTHGLTLHQGVYIAALGPSFETPAEIRAFRSLGVDLVGMSTVPEVIVARHCGLRVAAISAVTNLAAGLSDEHLTHDNTLRYGNMASQALGQLILHYMEAQ